MISIQPQSIKALTRTADNSERFQVGLGDDPKSRECVSKISLIEPGEETVVVLLTKEEWRILEGAFKALEGK